MYSKLIPFIFLSVMLSSCCWFVKVDCADVQDPPFSLPLSYSVADSVMLNTDTLNIHLETSSFLSTYEETGYDNVYLSMEVTWFDGNFISAANDRVELIESNLELLGTQTEGYNGPLPEDLTMKLRFPIPGYYLIQFYGGASRYEPNKPNLRRRCTCNDEYGYLSFEFDNDVQNSVWFPLYAQSANYSADWNTMAPQGAYFIKVE